MNLCIKNVSKKYGDNLVLDNISLNVKSGSICILLGPSGSGKSTLLNLIGGIENFEKGSIKIGNIDISNLNEEELTLYRRNELGFIFQFYNLIPNLTVRENIELSGDLNKDSLDIDELLNILGLKECENKFPNQLSGGQQQRCAIGRALVKKPSILLCDEPTGALDSKSAKDILNLIEEVHKKYNNTIIIVTHNDNIINMANQIVRLHDGKIKSNEENKKILSAKEIEL